MNQWSARCRKVVAVVAASWCVLDYLLLPWSLQPTVAVQASAAVLSGKSKYLELTAPDAKRYLTPCMAVDNLCDLVAKTPGVRIDVELQERATLFRDAWLAQARLQGRDMLSRASQQRGYLHMRLAHSAVVFFIVGLATYVYFASWSRPPNQG